jgi:site-specific recombinase XerC
MAASSIARRLSAVAKLYEYGIDAEVLNYSPVDHVRRPKVPKDSFNGRP